MISLKFCISISGTSLPGSSYLFLILELLIGNSWSVQETRASEGTTSYLQTGRWEITDSDFILNKPFVDEVGYCL